MERTAPTIKNLNQAVRNREFWKKIGLSDEQADLAVKSPDAEAFAARSIANADKTKAAFQGIVDSTRQDFSARYGEAYGDTLGKPVADVSPLVKAFNVAGQPGSERELSPGFAKWLNSKEAQLKGAINEPVGVGDTPFAQLPANLQKQIQATTKNAAPQFTIQDLRDIRTELRENLPSNPTPLEKKAATQVEQALNQVHDSELQKARRNQRTDRAHPRYRRRLRPLHGYRQDARPAFRAVGARVSTTRSGIQCFRTPIRQPT